MSPDEAHSAALEIDPRGDVVVITDASVEGEEATSVLRARGFVVVDVPLALLEAHFTAEPPKVLILDVDQPRAIETGRKLRSSPAGARAHVLCLGDPLRANELFDAPGGRLSLDDVFERPVDIQRLADRVQLFATPSGISYSSRGTTPPPMYAPRASLPPPSESLPPISEFPRPADPLDAGLLPIEDADMLGAVVLSPDLAEILARAERRVANNVDRMPSSPGVADDADCPLPPEMLAPLEEPLDPLEDDLGTGAGSAGGPDGTGSAQLAALLEGAHGSEPGSGTGAGSAPFPGVSPAAVTSSGVPVGASATSARAPILPAPPSQPRYDGFSQSSVGESVAGATGSGTGAGTNAGSTTSTLMGSTLMGSSLMGSSLMGSSMVGALPGAQTATATAQGAPPAGPGTRAEPTSPFSFHGTAPQPSGGAAAARGEPGTSAGLKASELAASVSPARLQSGAGRVDLAAPVETAAAPVRFQEARVFGEGRASMALAFEERIHRERETRPPPGPEAPREPRRETAAGPSPSRREEPRHEPRREEPRREEPRRTAEPARSSGARTATDTSGSNRDSGNAMPMVFAEMEGGRPLARAIATRHSGSLAFNAGSGVRRIVLLDGDVVTAGSEVADESLVSFLASRGDIDRDAAARLAGRLPPSGRHAGAALIAQGFLAQDDLWPVLRAHAEWLIGKAIVAGPGTVEPEDEAPGRLKAEPGVFGGATGAEVLVEMMRRVIPAAFAIERLGGAAAVFEPGKRPNLLGECALSEVEQAVTRSAPGRSVGELCADGEGDLATVLWALAELGVLGVLAPARPSRAKDDKPAPDPLDDEAIRQRVRARLALVREGDYFSLLGVSRSATSYEIKRAYLELRRTFEPGRLLTAGTADLLDDVTLVVEVLDEAYDILRDQNRRERYRRAIDAHPSD